MKTLEEATSATAGVLAVDDTWMQGRGAYGGLVIGTLVREIERRVGDPQRAVRSVTAEIPAPTTPGEATIEVEILRSGNSVTVARAAVAQASKVTAHAVAVLATTRDGARDVAWRDLEPPSLTPAGSLAPFALGGSYPQFTQHFEYLIAAGRPGEGSDPITTGYIRAKRPGFARDAAYIAAMIDAWYPAFFVRASRQRPLATIAFTLELVEGLEGLPADEPLVYRGSVPVCRDGYFLELRELWGRDGRLVARNHQTFAIIQ